MDIKIRNLRRSSGHVRNFVPGWHRVFIALVLTVIIGSASQTTPVLAAPATDSSIDIWLDARTLGSQTVCVGEQVVIRVNVLIRVRLNDKRLYYGRIGPAEIRHVLVGSGTVSPKKLSTGVTSQVADFTFTAREPGKDSVIFEGAITIAEAWGVVLSRHTVVGSIDLTVVECNYEVTTISRWDNFPISLLATMEAKMKADDAGHLTGTGTVKWVTNFTVPDQNAACGGGREISATDSQVNLSGDVSESGQMTVNITYLPTMFSMKGWCSIGPMVDVAYEITPAPLTITVPSSGSGSKQTHALTGIPAGYALIAVFPEE